MATFLHHIYPWMQSSIAEAEQCLEHKMDQHTERKIAEVHQCLDSFELRVLSRPAPQVDVSTLQAAVDSLRADIDMILEARVPEFEAPSAEPTEEKVMLPYSPFLRFHNLPIESMPRGARVERRMRLEQGQKSDVRWRLRGEPHLLMRRCIGSGL